MTTEGNTTFPRGDKRGSVSQKNEKKKQPYVPRIPIYRNVTSKRIWECSIRNEKRSALSKCCVRIVHAVCHTQSTATRASHVTVSMLCSVSTDCRRASSVPEVCLRLHRHCKSCMDSPDTGFATDTELTRYLALLFTSSRGKKILAYEIRMLPVCWLPACMCIRCSPISIFKTLTDFHNIVMSIVQLKVIHNFLI